MTRRTVLRDIQKFYALIQPAPTGCHEWMGRRKKPGRHQLAYGELSFAGHQEKAHRVAWQLERGPLRPGECVLHTCDVPWCVNIAHLFLGTRKDNVADMVAKRRQAMRERNNSKLTTDQVQYIRAHPEERISVLARRFKVDRSTISVARSGHKWISVDHAPLPRPRRDKLTPAAARAIRALQGTMTRAAIARQFGISPSQVRWVLLGRCWPEETDRHG